MTRASDDQCEQKHNHLVYEHSWTIMTLNESSWFFKNNHKGSWTSLNLLDPSWNVLNLLEPSRTVFNTKLIINLLDLFKTFVHFWQSKALIIMDTSNCGLSELFGNHLNLLDWFKPYLTFFHFIQTSSTLFKLHEFS